MSVVRGLAGNAGFRRLYGTRLLSQGADGIFQASLASAVLFSPERETDAAKVALAFCVLLLPYSLVGPFAGVLLARWGRSRVLVRANLVRASLGVAVAAVLASAGATHPVFVLLALAVVSVNRFYLAALSAALPRVVGTPELVTANALSVTSGTFATLTGAGLGVAARGSGSDPATAVVALGAAVVYVLSALVARRFPARRLGPDQVAASPLCREMATVVRGMLDGARHLADRPPAAHALAAITAARFLFGVMTVLTLLVYRNHFTDSGLLRAGLPGLTQVVVASGVGTVTAAVVTPVATHRIGKPAWLAGSLLLGGAAGVTLGLPYTLGSFLGAGLVLGFVMQATKISVDTLLQEQVDDEFRGRAFSFYDTLFNVSFVAAAALAAGILPDDGVSRPVVAVLGIGYGITAVGYGAATFRERTPSRRANSRA